MSNATSRVLVQTYTSPIDAEVACGFLREHGVDAMVQVPPEAAAAMSLMAPLTVYRLFVAETELDTAREVLAALNRENESHGNGSHAAATDEAPYRGDVRSRQTSEHKREWIAMLLPLGLGQWYARHTVSAAMVGITSLLLLATAIGRSSMGALGVALVLYVIDGLQARYAARTFNRGSVADTRTQVVHSFGAIVLAVFVSGFIIYGWL